jgi:hypothetical protein
MEGIKKYVKERDEMLLKRSVSELRKFVKNHAEFYEKEYIENFEKASDEVVEITLHKMIANVTSLPEEFVKESIVWLLERGYSPIILQ